jgi:7,8-dihydroneopterin aldolase/epimerase/oxygenase
MQAINLRGMRFHALVGILPHERVVPQPIVIDLSVDLLEGEGIVDYRVLYQTVADVVAAGPIEYLEQAGDLIARRTLDRNARVSRVRVALRKPHVALAGPLEYAEVVTELFA